MVHLAICMHGMLGLVLLCNYSGSEKADAIKRHCYESTSRLGSCAGMGPSVASMNGSWYFRRKIRNADGRDRPIALRGRAKEMARRSGMASGHAKKVYGA